MEQPYVSKKIKATCVSSNQLSLSIFLRPKRSGTREKLLTSRRHVVVLTSGSASRSCNADELASCSSVVRELLMCCDRDSDVNDDDDEGNFSAGLRVDCPQPSADLVTMEGLTVQQLDEVALGVVVSWVNHFSQLGGATIVAENFLDCLMIPFHFDDHCLSEEKSTSNLLNLFIVHSRLKAEEATFFFTKCLQQETDRELVTTIFDTLPVLMRILEFAAFLRVQALQSWCAAFVAFLVHVTVANADMSLALSTGNVRQDALPAVDSSVVVGLRSLLRIVNEWPEACNGKSPF